MDHSIEILLLIYGVLWMAFASAVLIFFDYKGFRVYKYKFDAFQMGFLRSSPLMDYIDKGKRTLISLLFKVLLFFFPILIGSISILNEIFE